MSRHLTLGPGGICVSQIQSAVTGRNGDASLVFWRDYADLDLTCVLKSENIAKAVWLYIDGGTADAEHAA